MQRQVLKEQINLPEGLKQDQKLRVLQMGHAADVFTSTAGDLLLTVQIEEHEFFKRSGKDIETEIPLSLLEAIKGTTITVQTLHGAVNVETEPGISTGDMMVLANFGVPEFDPPDNYDPLQLRGDHKLKFKVLLPEFNPESDSVRDELIK